MRELEFKVGVSEWVFSTNEDSITIATVQKETITDFCDGTKEITIKFVEYSKKIRSFLNKNKQFDINRIMKIYNNKEIFHNKFCEEHEMFYGKYVFFVEVGVIDSTGEYTLKIKLLEKQNKN